MATVILIGSDDEDGDDDDECIMVDAMPSPRAGGGSRSAAANAGRAGVGATTMTAPAATPAAADDDDEEIELVGCANKVALPHARCHCPEHRFRINVVASAPARPSGGGDGGGAATNDGNAVACANCYCWVCDVPAADCGAWAAHCDAHDKGAEWKALRERARAFARGGAGAADGAGSLAWFRGQPCAKNLKFDAFSAW